MYRISLSVTGDDAHKSRAMQYACACASTTILIPFLKNKNFLYVFKALFLNFKAKRARNGSEIEKGLIYSLLNVS